MSIPHSPAGFKREKRKRSVRFSGTKSLQYHRVEIVLLRSTARHAARKVVPAELWDARNSVIRKIDGAYAARGAIAQALVYELFLCHDLYFITAVVHGGVGS